MTNSARVDSLAQCRPNTLDNKLDDVSYFYLNDYFVCPPNGSRYPLVGGTRERHFAGTNLQPRKLLKNAATPTSRVHALLGAGGRINKTVSLNSAISVRSRQHISTGRSKVGVLRDDESWISHHKYRTWIFLSDIHLCKLQITHEQIPRLQKSRKTMEII